MQPESTSRLYISAYFALWYNLFHQVLSDYELTQGSLVLNSSEGMKISFKKLEQLSNYRIKQ